MNPDYTLLYRELGLQPGCSLDDFRRAYRRHVASLHPDRIGMTPVRETGALPLPDIIALHDQAMRFHRRYGRLPGASHAAVSVHATQAATPPVADDAAASDMRDNDAAGGMARRWLPWLVVAALLLLAIGIHETPPQRADPPPPRRDGALPSLPEQSTLPTTLALDMDASTVLAIQGEPLQRRGDRWDYGPSWLEFDRGRLVDWYSSPLNRLKTATTSPQPGPAD